MALTAGERSQGKGNGGADGGGTVALTAGERSRYHLLVRLGLGPLGLPGFLDVLRGKSADRGVVLVIRAVLELFAGVLVALEELAARSHRGLTVHPDLPARVLLGPESAVPQRSIVPTFLRAGEVVPGVPVRSKIGDVLLLGAKLLGTNGRHKIVKEAMSRLPFRFPRFVGPM